MKQPQKKMARSTTLALDPYSPKHTKRQRKQTPRMHTEFILHRKKKMFPWALQWQNPSRCTNACKAGPARLQRADIEQRRAPQAALTKLLFVLLTNAPQAAQRLMNPRTYRLPRQLLLPRLFVASNLPHCHKLPQWLMLPRTYQHCPADWLSTPPSCLPKSGELRMLPFVSASR